LESQEGKDHFEDPDVVGRIILKGIFRNSVWDGFMWLSIGASGGLFRTR
jgi:hypothetical protein